MSELLVIVPTRSRPQVVTDLRNAFYDNSAGAASLLLAVDDDDPALSEYLSIAELYGIQIRVGKRLRLGGTLNEVALEYADKYPYLGFMGDDHRPRTFGWDSHYVQVLKSKLFVYGDDLLQGEGLPTQVAMRSSVVTTLGYMCPPGLIHMFLDDAWKAWGYGAESIQYLPEVVVEHLHPSNGKGVTDRQYEEVWQLMEPDSIRWREYSGTNSLFEDIHKLKGLL